MPEKLTAKASININANPAKVWSALTDPAQIKQYMFGTTAKSDWKKGSKLTYTGVWEGKEYEEKGEIIDIEPEKLLHTTFFSPGSGKEDKPENYHHIKYILEPNGNGTKLSITQDNNDTAEMVEHSEKNWNMILDLMKKMLEKN